MTTPLRWLAALAAGGAVAGGGVALAHSSSPASSATPGSGTALASGAAPALSTAAADQQVRLVLGKANELEVAILNVRKQLQTTTARAEAAIAGAVRSGGGGHAVIVQGASGSGAQLAAEQAQLNAERQGLAGEAAQLQAESQQLQQEQAKLTAEAAALAAQANKPSTHGTTGASSGGDDGGGDNAVSHGS